MAAFTAGLWRAFIRAELEFSASGKARAGEVCAGAEGKWRIGRNGLWGFSRTGFARCSKLQKNMKIIQK
jgi:hypothetical protein